MATAEEFVQKCLEEVGDEYEYGAENTPGTPFNETDEWDCSELVQVKLQELGIDAPDGSTAQLNWCQSNGTIIPLEEAKQTRGALLLREGHVAVSLGDSRTVEAMGEQYGVGTFSAENRTFTHGGLVPGLSYDQTPVTDETDNRYNDRDPNDTLTATPGQKCPDKRRKIRKGQNNGPVKFIQRRLKKLGLYKGKIDQIFGDKTEQAVKAFQRNSRITEDGQVGPQTWKAMRAQRRTAKTDR